MIYYYADEIYRYDHLHFAAFRMNRETITVVIVIITICNLKIQCFLTTVELYLKFKKSTVITLFRKKKS